MLQSAAALAIGARSALASQRQAELLEEISHRAALYFIEQSDPATGLVLDRANADGSGSRSNASIAATGFGLSALCISALRGYLAPDEAEARVLNTLVFLAHHAPQERGFFYHFMDARSGQRSSRCELSSVDTAWLLCGVIHARQHFSSPGIRGLANEIVRRVQWNWMLNGGSMLSHGWTPERGFLPYRWDRYSELLAMYLLAMGSGDFAIPSSCWHAWERPMTSEAGSPYIESAAPLFVHQYSHAWLDFRDRQDAYADYFENSRLATLRHRRFCLDMRNRFPWFDNHMWGITASDSRYGYIDWGGPQTPANARIDGTLVPCASGGSIAFLPDECLSVLAAMRDRYGKRVWSRYGFIDAFNPRMDWWAEDVLGIDLGITLLMVENLRTQSVWSSMMQAMEVQRGFRLAGFERRGSSLV